MHFLQREDYIYLPPTGNRKLEGELATSIAEKSSPDIAKLGHQSKVPTINETTDGAGATSPKPRNKDLQEVTTIMTGNRKLEGEPATSIAEKSSPDIAKLGHQSKVPTINETTDGAGATSPKPRNKDLQEVTTIMTRLYLFTPEKTSSHHVNYLSSMQAGRQLQDE